MPIAKTVRLRDAALAEPPVAAARRVSLAASRRAPALDVDAAFPRDDVLALGESGLLHAPVPSADGGAGLGEEPGQAELCAVLALIGRGSLPLGRVYEGHVNALALIARYGTPGQRRTFFADAAAGHLFGVWNTEPPADGLTFEPAADALRLHGGKSFATGAGFVTRALVTARPRGDEADRLPRMLVVALQPGTRADLSGWRAHGMRASATGTLDFSGIVAPATAELGRPDDYHAQPFFSGGAWRFAAVQLGGIEAVFEAWRSHLSLTGRGGDPHQLARLGEGAIAVETARLWVAGAAARVATPRGEADAVVAYVNLARLAVERAGLEILGLAQRSVGLAGFLRDHPLERLGRDLATYLRQPAPDRALTTAAAFVLAAETGADALRPDRA